MLKYTLSHGDVGYSVMTIANNTALFICSLENGTSKFSPQGKKCVRMVMDVN